MLLCQGRERNDSGNISVVRPSNVSDDVSMASSALVRYTAGKQKTPQPTRERALQMTPSQSGFTNRESHIGNTSKNASDLATRENAVSAIAKRSVAESNAMELYQERSLALSTIEPLQFRRKAVKLLNNSDYSDLKALVKNVYDMTSRARNNELCVNCYDQRVDHNLHNMNLCVSCIHVNPARCHYCQLQYESTEFLERLKAPGRFPTCLDCANRIYSAGQPNFCEFCKRHCAWKSSWTGSDSVPSARFRNFCDMCCTARQRSNENPKVCKKCLHASLFRHPHGAKAVCINCDVVQAPGRPSIHFFFMDPSIAAGHSKLVDLPVEDLRRKLAECKEEFTKKETRKQELLNRFHTQEGMLQEERDDEVKDAIARHSDVITLRKDIASLEGQLASINKDGAQRVRTIKERIHADTTVGQRTYIRVQQEMENATANVLTLQNTIRESRELNMLDGASPAKSQRLEVCKQDAEDDDFLDEVENQNPNKMRKLELLEG